MVEKEPYLDVFFTCFGGWENTRVRPRVEHLVTNGNENWLSLFTYIKNINFKIKHCTFIWIKKTSSRAPIRSTISSLQLQLNNITHPCICQVYLPQTYSIVYIFWVISQVNHSWFNVLYKGNMNHSKEASI